MLDLRELPPRSPLDAQVAERIGDHRIVEWDTVTPEEHVADIAAALTTFFSMVPTGELAIEDGEWTPERYLGNERRTAELSPQARGSRDRARRLARRLHRCLRVPNQDRAGLGLASPSCFPATADTHSVSR